MNDLFYFTSIFPRMQTSGPISDPAASEQDRSEEMMGGMSPGGGREDERVPVGTGQTWEEN